MAMANRRIFTWKSVLIDPMTTTSFSRLVRTQPNHKASGLLLSHSGGQLNHKFDGSSEVLFYWNLT